MRRVGAAEPFGTDAIVETEGVETNLKSTHVQSPVRSARILRIDGLCEEGRAAVATGFG